MVLVRQSSIPKSKVYRNRWPGVFNLGVIVLTDVYLSDRPLLVATQFDRTDNMEHVKTLSEDDIRYLLDNADFPEHIRNAGEKVAVIMTQDWCHEWHDMQGYLPQ